MAVRLTDTAIQSAAKRATEGGKRVDLSDATLPGLRLRLTPAGGRSWVLACRDPLGRMRGFPLGDHPGLGIADARDAARAMRVEVRKGADPVAEARRKRVIGREAKEGIGTLTALLDQYAAKRGAALKSWPECRRRIDSVFKGHLGKPLAMLRPGDLQLSADSHTAQQSAAAAVRFLRPVLKWGGQRGYVATEAAALHRPATVQRRDRVLSRDELKALLPVLAASPGPYPAALHFMLLMLARREEVAQARWRDIDLEARAWTLGDEIVAEHSRQFRRDQVIYNFWHYVPVLVRKPGALRNGAPFKDWDLPPGLAKVYAKLKSHADGDRQFVKVLGAVLDHGLEAVEAACAEALEAGIASGDVILAVLTRQRQPAMPPSITTPDALRLTIEPMADCGRYDSIRKIA